jgi:hypothetical protein
MISRRALLAALAALPMLGRGALAAPAGRVGGARILLRDNRLWIQVRFGTRGPFAFIIDTGAAINLIRADVARRLGLPELRPVHLAGVGGLQQFMLREARDVTLGTTNVGTVRFGAYDGEALPIHREAAGALSASMLTVADTDLDFDAGEWRIYPDDRGDRAGFTRLESSIRQSASAPGATPILVDVELDGRPYRLQLDTGAPIGIALWPGATRRSGLWNERTPFSPARRRGIGGVGAPTRLVRAGALRLGDMTFERPLVSLTDPDTRDHAQDGLLGLPLIGLMNLSTDLSAGRLWARRNARPPEPERYGLAGLWVEEGQGGLVVTQLSPQSPAAEAGLAVGDVIVGMPLAGFVRRLAGAPGDRVSFDYRRGAQARTARLTLRAFL